MAIERLVSTISHFHNCWQTYSDNINKAPFSMFPSVNTVTQRNALQSFYVTHSKTSLADGLEGKYGLVLLRDLRMQVEVDIKRPSYNVTRPSYNVTGWRQFCFLSHWLHNFDADSP